MRRSEPRVVPTAGIPLERLRDASQNINLTRISQEAFERFLQTINRC
jgi:hypothetical protein